MVRFFGCPVASAVSTKTSSAFPDFADTRFVHPYDFIARNPYPLDREGHGTFVAGMIAESTNNGIGLTGKRYVLN